MVILIALLMGIVIGFFIGFLFGMLYMLHGMNKCCPKAYELWMDFLQTNKKERKEL